MYIIVVINNCKILILLLYQISRGSSVKTNNKTLLVFLINFTNSVPKIVWQKFNYRSYEAFQKKSELCIKIKLYNQIQTEKSQ